VHVRPQNQGTHVGKPTLGRGDARVDGEQPFLALLHRFGIADQRWQIAFPGFFQGDPDAVVGLYSKPFAERLRNTAP
jgi:hypothetical protein